MKAKWSSCPVCILFIVCIYIYKYIYMYVSVYVPVCVHIHPHTCNWREEAVFLHCLCGDLHVPPRLVPCAVLALVMRPNKKI